MGSEPKFTPGWVEVVPGYEVSRLGEVASISSGWRGNGRFHLVQDLNSHGYPRVRLTIDGRRKVYLVHKLVAAAFLLPRPSPEHEIRHLDGNKTNNRASNLAWGTRQDNADDRARHGRNAPRARRRQAPWGIE